MTDIPSPKSARDVTTDRVTGVWGDIDHRAIAADAAGTLWSTTLERAIQPRSRYHCRPQPPVGVFSNEHNPVSMSLTPSADRGVLVDAAPGDRQHPQSLPGIAIDQSGQPGAIRGGEVALPASLGEGAAAGQHGFRGALGVPGDGSVALDVDRGHPSQVRADEIGP